MFIFLLNVKDRKNSSTGLGFHSYKPKESKGIFAIEILSYEILTRFLQIKGGPSGCGETVAGHFRFIPVTDCQIE